MINEKFKFPKIYAEMDKLGWLDTSETNSYLYLWLNDMEWYRCEDIRNYEYEDGEVKNIVSFAHTGGGDKWGWYLEESNRLPVVLCYHDECEGMFYAENIEGAIFRNILEFVSDSLFYVDASKAESYQLNIVEIRQYLLNWRRRFDKWFNKSWLEELDEFIKLKFKICHTKYGNYYALLTPEEADEKIKKYLDFDLINKTFVWYSEE